MRPHASLALACLPTGLAKSPTAQYTHPEPCPAPRLAYLLCRAREGVDACRQVLGERLHLQILGEGLSVLALQTSADAGNLGAESKKAPFSLFFLVYKVDGMVLSGGQPPPENFLVHLADF